MKDNLVILFIGGLGFFFYGMYLMSDGLKQIAGSRLKNFMGMVTKLPILGVLVGALVTLFIQSSSATTVMVVGFVNAGLLTLQQAISVIMGANIGTTFTAWLVSSMSVFKITQYALPSVSLGVIFLTFGKTRKTKALGEVFIGFGILFLGLDFMKDSFSPLKNSERVKDYFVMFSRNPLLGVLVGTVFTVLLQSSSATIAIVQVLAFNGVIDFNSAVPLILGDNIGTTITAQLAAAAGTNINARRSAMSHTIFNVIGVTYMLIFVYTGWYVKAIDFIIPGTITTKNIMFHIAVAHSAFNVVNVIVFLPFIGFLEKMSIRLVPQRKGSIEIGPQYLEKHLLATPTLALSQARNETIYMLEVAGKAVTCSHKAFLDNDRAMIEKVAHYERATDNLQSEITQYLIDLFSRELAEEDSQKLPVLIHSVNDIERIGDHAYNVAELARNKMEDRLVFSDAAMQEIKTLVGEVNQMLMETCTALKNDDPQIAKRILEIEERINQQQVQFKEAHVDRLNKGTCRLDSNYVYLDFVDNMEKIADHLTNIAQGVLAKMQWKSYKQLDDKEQEAASPA